MNDIIPQDPLRPMLAAHGAVNAGAVAIESERAIAEAQGQLTLAKRFPRNLSAAYAEIIEACKLPSMANVAFYTVPQGGQKVTGPSIKLIEQVAQSVTNMEWGHKELSRKESGAGPNDFGRSEVMVYAWDKEKNNFSPRQITILHVLDTKDGPRKLRDQRDIDNKIANVASKQMRGRLQALLPKWLIEAAVEECKKTLSGNNEKPVAQRVRDMIGAFSKYGVTVALLEQHLGHQLDETTIDELIDLTGVFNALREGAKPSEYFNLVPAVEASPAAAAIMGAITQQAESAQAPAAAPAAKPRTTRAPAQTPVAQAQVAESKPEQRQAVSPAPQPTANDPQPGDDEPVF